MPPRHLELNLAKMAQNQKRARTVVLGRFARGYAGPRPARGYLCIKPSRHLELNRAKMAQNQKESGPKRARLVVLGLGRGCMGGCEGPGALARPAGIS